MALVENARLFVRRIDQAYRLCAKIDGLEHTHHHPFPNKDRAWSFLRRVRGALEDGHDLNLAHWETEAL